MNWMKYKPLYFAISLLFLIPGIISLLIFGFNPSIEFTGGSKIQYQIQPGNIQPAQDIIHQKYPAAKLELEGSTLRLSLQSIDQEAVDQLTQELKNKYQEVQLQGFETVGPSLGRQMLKRTITAAILVAVGILIFTAYSFKSLKFGVSAVLAMLHDSLILMGSFSLLGHFFNIKTDLLFVTALLTTLSFSVHDTIVVFDRIRQLGTTDLQSTANQAITDTIVRSVNNSLTIIFMLLALFLLGGESIHWFALALLIGATTGTYSSTFTAVPLLVTWDQIENR